MQRNVHDKTEVVFQPASKEDIPGIIDLYIKVYHGKYTLTEVSDPVVIEKKIEDPGYFWSVAKHNGRLIGSVIFTIDPVHKIGKSYAAVVLSEYRGKDVMRTMVKMGLQLLTEKTRMCDVIYATTRTVSFAPQVVLEHLGFMPFGIFPNVRKVESFETHGLELYFSKKCMEYRRKKPVLIPELLDFYEIVRTELNLEEAETAILDEQDPRQMGKKLEFDVCTDKEKVAETFYRYQDKDLMQRVFFPFTDPNMLFSAKDGSADIFVNFSKLDGNGVMLGYRHTGPDIRNTLMWFCEEASKSGMRYIEMLVSAYRPEKQRMALDARFLPCAYFPAMIMNENAQREDYLIFSRSFESLDFMNMNLVDTNRRFLDAFMKCWYELLVRCQPDFDEEWRIG